MNYQILQNQKQKPLLVYNGYSYTQKRVNLASIVWRCTERTRGCKAVASSPVVLSEMGDGAIITERGGHNHPQKVGIVHRYAQRAKMVALATSTCDQPSNIIRNVLECENQSSIAITGTEDACKQMIRRARRDSFDPSSITEPVLEIGEDLMKTRQGDRFYQFGPNYSNGIGIRSNIAVFFNSSMIRAFKRNPVWIVDGTFYVCPRPWYQFFTIAVIYDHHIVPIVYALLPSKAESVYDQFVSVLRQLIPGLSPEVILCDFEKAEINAFSRGFPEAKMSGCMFHLGQNIQKEIGNLGLTRDYSSSVVVRKFVKALKCLALVPLESVHRVFESLRNHNDFPQMLTPLYAYFYRTYIGPEDLTERPRAAYPPSLWNNRYNLFKDLPRTNNAIEGYHNKLNRDFGKNTYSPREFIKSLIIQEEGARQKLARIQSGEKLRRDPKWIICSETIISYIVAAEADGIDPPRVHL